MHVRDSYDKVATCTKFVKNLTLTIFAGEAKILEISGLQKGGKSDAPVGQERRTCGARVTHLWGKSDAPVGQE